MSILFLSCYTPRYVYSPPAQNVATLTQKGDSRLAILYSTNAGSNNEIVEIGKATSNGLDVHSAYAISNHVITQFNFFTETSKIAIETTVILCRNSSDIKEI